MRVRRIIGATVLAGVAASVGLLAAGGVGAAATPTPISLGLAGMSSATCPLPLNGVMAVKPGTTVQFKPGMLLGSFETLSVSIQRETTVTPRPAAQVRDVPAVGVNVAFPTAGTYDLSWRTSTGSLLGLVPPVLSATTVGKMVISANAQKCIVVIQVPVPSVSSSLLPSAVTGPVNGILSSGAGAVNGVLSPVNSAVGPILGGVNGTVGGVIAPITGGANPGGGTTGGNTGPGTLYKPTGPTIAQKTVPQNAGSGTGAAGNYVGITGSSINAPALGFKGTGTAGSANSGAVKSGGSPKTVELAANKPRSALNGFSTVIVVIAIVALSGATAFYARTFLLHPPQAQA